MSPRPEYGEARDLAPTRRFETTSARGRRRRSGYELSQDLDALGEVVEVGQGLLDPHLLTEARSVLTHASRRRALAPAVTVVALLGATGSGKSSLFNALAGAPLARTAVTRPTTTAPLAALPAQPGRGVGEQIGALLDWLEVTERVQRPSDEGLGASTVLLDLPDIDSDVPQHRQTAARLAGLVDVLVWVLDPQKYADAVIHEDFITPLSGHSEVTVVALNQVDLLDQGARKDVLADLARLLDNEGLGSAAVTAVSARTGEALEDLRGRVSAVAASTTAAEQRLAADVRAAARRLWDVLAPQDEVQASGGTTASAASAREQVAQAAMSAAGGPTVVQAATDSLRYRAAGYVGWPPVRWLRGLRKDPLRALHLGSQALGGSVTAMLPSDSRDAVVPRTSLPPVSASTAGALRTAVHELGVAVTTSVPPRIATEIVARNDKRAEALVPALDRAVAMTDLDQRRQPRWWTMASWLQTTLLLVAIAGGVWLGALWGLAQLGLLLPRTPKIGDLPAPLVLLVCGLGLGMVLAVAGTSVAAVGARRRGVAVRRRLRQATDQVVRERILKPLTDEVTGWERLRELLETLM